MKKNKYNIGDRVIAFDSQSWSKTGDIDNNEIYYLPAKVIGIRKSNYTNELMWLADVKFDNGKISNGLFQNGLKPLK
jgi:hypothetical protein